MLLFHGFKSKKELRETLKDAESVKEPVLFSEHIQETSIFGQEYKGAGTYCVCMNHPKRTVFANITVDKDDRIIKVA